MLPSRLAALLLAALALTAAVAAGPAAAADAERTRAFLARAMRAAGSASGAYVADLDSGRALFARRADVPRMPASVNKLATTSASLRLLGPEGRLVTSLLGEGALTPDGTWHGDLVLRGGGDPELRRPALAALARAAAARGIVRVAGRVVGDESAWDARRGGPESGWRASPWVGSLSALAIDGGRLRRSGRPPDLQPARTAARGLRRALERAGVEVEGGTAVRPAGAEAVALVDRPSRPLAAIVAHTNTRSDNFAAEMLLKGLGARFGAGGTHPAGAAVVRRVLREWGVHARVVDGSGLSRRNAISPRAVVRLLRRVASGPLAVPFLDSLPVAGRSGTLAERMRNTAAQDACRGKTGTLRDVSALVGVCTAADGTPLAFAFLMNRTSYLRARRLQDRMAAALARYAA